MSDSERLIAAYLDDALTPSEQDQLLAWLRADPAHMQAFVEANLFERQIGDAVRSQAIRDGAACFVDAKTSPPQPIADRPRRPAMRTRRFALGAAVALAAAGIVAVWFGRGVPEPTALGVAVLSRYVDVRWGADTEEYAPGAVLPPQPLRIESGAAQFDFYSGARVIVEGPAVFQPISAEEGFLSSGKLSAHVPPQAHGFRIRSAKFTIVDHGTEFGVTVDDDAPSEVHVFEGKVELSSGDKQGPPRSLLGGEAVRFEPGTLQSIPANREGFLDEAELAHRDELVSRRRLTEWRAAAGALSQDPATVLHFDFETPSQGDRTLPNLATSASEDSVGSIVGCERTDGRWIGKKALQFRNEGDRVRLSTPAPLRQVTFLAWIRIDDLPHDLHSLLTADAEQTGALRWELWNTGRLRLEIGRDLGRRKLDWEAVDGEPVLTADRFGQWCLLATTFDGRTVRHYCNGRPCGSGASFEPPSLHIGSADLGNYHGPQRRNLVGKMDEFVVLGRVLSPAELMAYYEQGKP